MVTPPCLPPLSGGSSPVRCDLSPGAGCYKTAPLLFWLHLAGPPPTLCPSAGSRRAPGSSGGESGQRRKGEQPSRGGGSLPSAPWGAQDSGEHPRVLVTAASTQHAPLQGFPANLLPKCLWLAVVTRWQVQGCSNHLYPLACCPEARLPPRLRNIGPVGAPAWEPGAGGAGSGVSLLLRGALGQRRQDEGGNPGPSAQPPCAPRPHTHAEAPRPPSAEPASPDQDPGSPFHLGQHCPRGGAPATPQSQQSTGAGHRPDVKVRWGFASSPRAPLTPSVGAAFTPFLPPTNTNANTTPCPSSASSQHRCHQGVRPICLWPENPPTECCAIKDELNPSNPRSPVPRGSPDLWFTPRLSSGWTLG